MDCGIPFCNNGCPLGNLIPDWNDLVYRDHWREAIDRLHATNNFPEFTGRLCPAPCEAACVLGINQDPVTIKQVEVEIIDRAWAEGWVTPVAADGKTGKQVAVVGSGPAGLAAAQQLTRAGHDVVVFERADRIGGLLRYGIPEFKMEKRHLDRRLDADAGRGHRVPRQRQRRRRHHRRRAARRVRRHRARRRRHRAPRPADPGPRAARASTRPWSTCRWPTGCRRATSPSRPIDAKGKQVVIIGGGDTGADCLGTAHRQGAASMHQFEIMPRPPEERPDANPWPTWPMIYRIASAHEEGGERVLLGQHRALPRRRRRQPARPARPRGRDDVVDGRPTFEKVEGSDFELDVRAGVPGHGLRRRPSRRACSSSSASSSTTAATSPATPSWATNVDGVFVAGDMGRGQSLIVWAIAEGRACAAAVDRHLMGDTELPAPIAPTAVSLR